MVDSRVKVEALHQGRSTKAGTAKLNVRMAIRLDSTIHFE